MPNEVTQVRPLPDGVGLAGAIVTLDAMHCQRDTARHQAEDKHADYIFTAGPARIAACARGHWGIENKLHWVRDITYGEDASRVAPGRPRGTWPACATSPSAPCAPAAGPHHLRNPLGRPRLSEPSATAQPRHVRTPPSHWQTLGVGTPATGRRRPSNAPSR